MNTLKGWSDIIMNRDKENHMNKPVAKKVAPKTTKPATAEKPVYVVAFPARICIMSSADSPEEAMEEARAKAQAALSGMPGLLVVLNGESTVSTTTEAAAAEEGEPEESGEEESEEAPEEAEESEEVEEGEPEESEESEEPEPVPAKKKAPPAPAVKAKTKVPAKK